MSSLLHIEHALGRVRSFANAPRSIDLDLLLYSEEVIEVPTLTVPHPRMHERAFVLVPLNDIAPDVIHPQLELPIRQLLQRVGSTHEVRRTHYLLDDIARNA